LGKNNKKTEMDFVWWSLHWTSRFPEKRVFFCGEKIIKENFFVPGNSKEKNRRFLKRTRKKKKKKRERGAEMNPTKHADPRQQYYAMSGSKICSPEKFSTQPSDRAPGVCETKLRFTNLSETVSVPIVFPGLDEPTPGQSPDWLKFKGLIQPCLDVKQQPLMSLLIFLGALSRCIEERNFGEKNALALLKMNCSSDIVLGPGKTFREAIHFLLVVYASKDEVAILRTQLNNFRQKKTESVQSFIERVGDVMIPLGGDVGKIYEVVLRGLHDDVWKGNRRALTAAALSMRGPDCTWDDLRSVFADVRLPPESDDGVRPEQKQKKKKNKNALDSPARRSNKKQKFQPETCKNCLKVGHSKAECTNASVCWNCKKNGHQAGKCSGRLQKA
jgi:hypothetical protein